jgi:hypothetical protein
MTLNGPHFMQKNLGLQNEKEVCNCKANKQNGEGRRKTISIYTNNNNNLTNLNAVGISLLLLCGKSYAIG